MQCRHEPIYGEPSFTVYRRIEITRKHGKYQVALTPSGHDACERIAQWDESALGKKGFDREQLVARARAVDAENTRASKALIDAFAEQVALFAREQQ